MCVWCGFVGIICYFSIYLLILKFDFDDFEGVVGSVVVDGDSVEFLLVRFDWYLFFIGVIVDYYRSSGLVDILFIVE